MKAVAVFPKGREVRLVDVDEPRIVGPSQVKLRILDVGICGTDKEICAFDYGLPPKGADYLIIGHESLAEVIEAGPAARAVKVGDLVVTTVRRPCPHASCRACRSGRPDFCSTGDFTERGIKGLHGFMTEFVVEDERFLNPVPRNLRDVGVLVEPLTIAEKAAEQVLSLRRRLPWFATGSMSMRSAQSGEGQQAVVLGAGAVGLLGTMVLRAAGFETYVYNRTPAPNAKSRLVESLGASYVSPDANSSPRIDDLIGKVDLIYEAVGDPQVAIEMAKLLGPNGIYVLTGVPGRKGTFALDEHWRWRDLVLKNQVVLGVVNAGKEAYEAAIRDLALFERLWPGVLQSLISGRYRLEAYRDPLLGHVGGIKNVVAIAGEMFREEF